ncbi:hypothetical protein ACIQ7D_27085 [Streptomyces sp. NPDC096310]|uniref:hypothetical protein n=1 Tax=Streptomyces sp. NPDC096310 TaxID=3366082 RepID=UPI003802615D
MGGQPRGRIGHIRTTRPTALVSAVATLLAALFLCLGTDTETATGHHRDAAAVTISVADTSEAGTSAAGAAEAPYTGDSRYVCPYRDGDCGLIPHLGAAVLTVPAPAAAPDVALQQPYLEPPRPAGRAPRSGVFPRAPDLHVLQVLRT